MTIKTLYKFQVKRSKTEPVRKLRRSCHRWLDQLVRTSYEPVVQDPSSSLKVAEFDGGLGHDIFRLGEDLARSEKTGSYKCPLAGITTTETTQRTCTITNERQQEKTTAPDSTMVQ